MITYKDFRTKDELEEFQKNNKIKFIKIETVVKKEYRSEWFDPKLQYSSGYIDVNFVRLFFDDTL